MFMHQIADQVGNDVMPGTDRASHSSFCLASPM